MKRKQGFTLIEILMVVGLLGILIISFKQAFQVPNKDITYSQTCINYLYGDINNYLNASITSKWLTNTSWELFFPDYYTLSFLPTTNDVLFKYQLSDESTGTRKSLNLQTNMPWTRQCNKFNNNINISGDKIILNIKRGLIQNTNIPSFNINVQGNIAFTGIVPFFLCNTGSPCREISQIHIDSRAKTISQHNCLRFTWTSKQLCAERN